MTSVPQATATSQLQRTAPVDDPTAMPPSPPPSSPQPDRCTPPPGRRPSRAERLQARDTHSTKTLATLAEMQSALRHPGSRTGLRHDPVPTRWRPATRADALASHTATLDDLVYCETPPIPEPLPGWADTWTLTTRPDIHELHTVRAAHADIERILAATPSSYAVQHKGARAHCGLHYTSTQDESVPHQSMFEKRTQIALDFLGATHLIAQPFELAWRDHTGVARRHIPDYLCLLGGQVLVVDVRPAELLDDDLRDKFGALQTLCRRHGWSSTLVTGFRRPAFTNLEALNAHNTANVTPEAENILAALDGTGPLTIRDLETHCDHPIVARAVIQGLVWSHLLTIDLNETMHDGTLVRLASDTPGRD